MPLNETLPQHPEDQVRRDLEARMQAGELPAQIGRFVILELLGEGTYGAVYRARDPQLDREVALKIPRGLLPAARDKFLKEAKAAARVTHPNVCQVYEVGSVGSVPFIVSRYVRGGTLKGVIQRAPNGMDPHEALAVALKLAKAVVAAHDENIIHRDLKPENVLYDEKFNDYFITDFGLAKIAAEANHSSGGVKGTPLYMSPEQFGDGDRAGDVGPLSDVYSLGVILYEMLTGKPPFQGSNTFALLLAHLQTNPELLSIRRPNLSTRYDDLCLKALKKVPAERYASAKAFADAIDVALRPAPVLVQPQHPAQKATHRAQAEADNKRGDDFYFGRGVPQDYAKAREWYEKAATQNHAEAQANLGLLYNTGYGVPEDYTKAREWYEKAATQGNPTGQAFLAELLENGRGGPTDHPRALELYREAAEQGNQYAKDALKRLGQPE